MAVALVTGQLKTVTGTIWTTDGIEARTFDIAAAVGNTVVVLFGALSNVTVSTVVDNGDSGGNTYSPLVTQVDALPAEIWMYSAPVTQPNATTITVTLTAPSVVQGFMVILEFSGLNNDDLLEMTLARSDTGSPYDSGTITTTVADSLLVGGLLGSGGTYTNDADSWTQALNWVGGLVAYKILTATTSTEEWSPTSSEAETVVQIAAAFNGAAAAGSPQMTRDFPTPSSRRRVSPAHALQALPTGLLTSQPPFFTIVDGKRTN